MIANAFLFPRHDLRRVFALFARRAGVSREKAGLAGLASLASLAGLGHETTDQYVRIQTSTEVDAVAEALGF